MMRSGQSTPDLTPVVLDLFCGAGGMSLGFQMAGYTIGLGVEIEDLPCRTYRHNLGRCHQGDICEISDPETFIGDYGLSRVDVIIGGPPCQGFSRIGRGGIRHRLKDPGYIHDPRNQYYKQFIRFVETLRPYYFVLENVPDMQQYSDGDGPVLEMALKHFRAAGYVVDWKVLQAHHYGVPQVRQRLFIIGNRLGQGNAWPEKTHEGNPVTVWQAISDLPIVTHNHREDDIPYRPIGRLNDYQRLMRRGALRVLFNHQTRWHNRQDLAAFAWLPEGGKYVDLPKRYKRYRDDIFKDKYWKLRQNRPSWTVEAHIGKDSYRFIYPSREGDRHPPRTISVREAARLQSFPDRFRFLGPFTKQFFQVGNAVPPLLARAIGTTILPCVLTAMGRAGVKEEDNMGMPEARLQSVGRENG
jgi:DNA (cytosine-5)-methyltransferase 1